jgi:hypothetical protein
MNQYARRTNGSNPSYMQPTAGLETAVNINRPMIEAMSEINSRVFEHMAAINHEWMTFLQRRWQNSLTLPQQFAQCRTPQDVIRVYTDYLQDAMQQYQTEIAELARLGQSIQSETAGIVRDTVEETSRSLRASG